MKNAFIVNTASKTGKSKALWGEIENHLKSKGVEYEAYITTKAGDATEYANRLTSTGEELNLFVVGGDGTLNEALNGIADFEKTYYIPVPSGSANDFVNGIGMSGTSIEIIDRALSSSEYKSLDVGKITYIKEDEKQERLFGVSAGIGVDAYVCLQALDSKLKNFLNKFGLGSATYGILTVGDIFTMPFSDSVVTTYFNGEKKEYNLKSTIFAAAMNCRAEGGVIPMAPDATPDCGYLTAFIAHDISRLKCFTMLPFLVAGKHLGKKGFDLLKFHKLTIALKDEMCVHTDGEHVGFLKEITFECLPGQLKVRGF